MVQRKVKTPYGGQILWGGNTNFKVESEANPGEYYMVNVEEPHCECMAFKFLGGCKHLKAAARALEHVNSLV